MSSTTGAIGGSGTTVPARFTVGSGFQQIRPNGSLATPVTNFNFNPYNIFQTPFQRFNIYGAAHYDVADNVEIFAEGSYNHDHVVFNAGPNLQTGITYINAGTTGAEVHLPFGGTKNTGNGHREAGVAALEVFSEWKSIYIDFSGRLQRAQIDVEQI